MRAKKSRIGLVLASIHTGASQRVWPSFASTALIEDKNLFIFPGGRLNAPADFENLRNSIYSLVNSDNLDGCISWSSTIRYTEPQEEFERFHSGFDPLPYVTITNKIPGHPCVEFDSYVGMKQLTSHFINVHKSKKIAFLKGPDFNQSALARFKGFEDALKEAGLPSTAGTPLATDPFNWNSGDAAAVQLFENRRLIPGKDFDTLIASSDLMALGAINYFAKHGYHIPGDYRAAGFNNSIESRLTEKSLTTIHIPYSGLSTESFRLLLNLLSKNKSKSANVENVYLPSELIIRESCGCVSSQTGKTIRKNEKTSNANNEVLLTKMISGFFKLTDGDADAFAAPVVRSLLAAGEQKNEDPFLKLLEKALIRFFGSGRETELLFNLIEQIASCGLVSKHLVKKLSPVVYKLIFKVREQLNFHTQYEKEYRNIALNSLKCELLGTRNRDSLLQSLARHLPKIGINTAGIALYTDDAASIWAGSFSNEGISPVREVTFPSRLLFPGSLKPNFSRGVFMVQPLFIENKSLGYFIHNAPFNDGVIFEELRSALSYALKGIFQLEEYVRAKLIAEQAERAKTEFLRALENEIYNPLAGVMEKINDLENIKGCTKAFKEELRDLKLYVDSRGKQAESLIELALFKQDELVLSKTLFNPGQLLPGIAAVHDTFPLILGDLLKLSQCFSFVREEYTGEYCASVSYGGLELCFKTEAAGIKKKNKIKDQILLLCERIILMHGGLFKKSKFFCEVTLPWPSMSKDETSVKIKGRHERMLVFGGFPPPACLKNLHVVQDTEPENTDNTAFIIWNSANAKRDELLKLSSLKHRNELKESSFLCYGKELAGDESIADGVERLLKSPERTILFIGMENPEDREYLDKLTGDIISIPSIQFFNNTVTAVNPQMIILNSVNAQGAAAIRRHPATVLTPVIMIGSRIDSTADVMTLSQYPRLIICHRCAASSPEFIARIKAVAGGDEILGHHTGAIVKKTIHYFDQNLNNEISRQKLADAINVNEDYLTRIFHKETGLSLWNYLNRMRVYNAAQMLLKTDDGIQNIALRCGFQDHAYFCRVFKKIYGTQPGQLRKQKKSE